ncbi:hypothetical protein JOE44_001928 [Chryseobacterium sp. PvR013]|uniref:hypothetical protein n=1 Tax=Chryseobacterium sp. PvR013 TaxID=2806595 RepID=UPI001AE68589|nr:hypothetical protein [Chryseobacterium sp. PvR013]MBP1165044.1 hypothetical protein [Chryseobacterium sp. PvR013]
MTRETIIEKLRNKYANLGLGDDILGSQADLILTGSPTDETIDGVVDGVGGLLKSIQSSLDKARQKPDPEKPKPVTQPNPNPEPKPGNPDQTLAEQVKALTQSVQALVTKTATDDKKGNLVKALAAKNIPEKYYNKFLTTVDYGEGYSEEDTVKSMETEFEEFKQAFATEGAKGGNPPIGTGGTEQQGQALKDIERLA